MKIRRHLICTALVCFVLGCSSRRLTFDRNGGDDSQDSQLFNAVELSCSAYLVASSRTGGVSKYEVQLTSSLGSSLAKTMVKRVLGGNGSTQLPATAATAHLLSISSTALGDETLQFDVA